MSGPAKTFVLTGATAKRLVWTGAFAAVTIVGSIYGAGLKMQSELKSERKTYAESSVQDQIAFLESKKQLIVQAKAPVERKLETLRKRIRDKEGKEHLEAESNRAVVLPGKEEEPNGLQGRRIEPAATDAVGDEGSRSAGGSRSSSGSSSRWKW